MASRHNMDCYCAQEHHTFPGPILLCPEHIYEELGLNSFREIKRKVLKPINFDNYDDRFKIKYVAKIDFTEIEFKKITVCYKIIISIDLISLDDKICVRMDICDNVPNGGRISYEDVSISYFIHDGHPAWIAEFGHNFEYPNLDPIKKHLNDNIVQNNDNNILLEPVRRQASF